MKPEFNDCRKVPKIIKAPLHKYGKITYGLLSVFVYIT